MNSAQAAAITRILIVATASLWVAWDLFAYVRYGSGPTISRQFAGWADRWWWFRYLLTIGVNLIVGHLVWSQHLDCSK